MTYVTPRKAGQKRVSPDNSREKSVLLQTCCQDSVCVARKASRVFDDSTTQCLLFPDIFHKPAVLQFDQRLGSSDGGAVLLKAADRRYGLIRGLAGCLRDKRQAGKLRFFSSLEALRDPQVFRRHLDPVRNVKWVVYAKAPFAGPQQVVDYVGRYTHRVAISNHRLLDIEDGQVKLNWRDYRDHNQQKIMTLSAEEFIRRFLLHVLPSGFHRIRYYGFLGNRYRKDKLEHCRQLLGMTPPNESSSHPQPGEDYRDRYEKLTGHSLRECPVCHRGRMITVNLLAKGRSPPAIPDTS